MRYTRKPRQPLISPEEHERNYALGLHIAGRLIGVRATANLAREHKIQLRMLRGNKQVMKTFLGHLRVRAHAAAMRADVPLGKDLDDKRLTGEQKQRLLDAAEGRYND